MSSKHVKDLPSNDPPTAAILVDLLIDDSDLYNPHASKGLPK